MNPPRLPATSHRPLMLVARVILAVSLVAGSAGIYMLLARKELADGQAAFAASDWFSAYSHFSRVTGPYRFGVFDQLPEIQALESETSLLSYADDRRSQNDFESALAAYATALKLFPASVKSAQVMNAAGETYAAWVIALQAGQDYALAVEKCQELGRTYPESIAARSVDELTAGVYWAWFETLLQQGEFEPAIEKLELIQSDYPQTTYGLQVRGQLAEVYGQWGRTLGMDGNWAAATETYERLRTEFSDEPAAQGAEGALAELYLRWAGSESQAHHYGVAIEKYSILLDEFAAQPEARAARVALAEAELRYASQLQADHQTVLAVVYASHGLDVFEKLLAESPDSVTAGQSELIRRTYQELGQLLIDSGHYLGALQLYAEAGALFTDPVSQSDWQAGQAAATQALSVDTGTDGQQVIAEAIQSACQGQPTNWSVVGSSRETVQFRLCSGSTDLSLGNLEAATPAALHYVVGSDAVSTTITSCAYTGAHVLTRYRNDVQLIIYDTVSGSIAAKATVTGPFPPSCPAYYSFPSGAFSTASISGGVPTPEAVQSVLTQLLAGLK